MTNIEFKVQFVSGSFGGKGSCKGIVLWGGGTWRAKVGVEGLDVRVHVAGSTRVIIGSQLASKEAGRVAMTRSRLGLLEAAHNGHPGPTHISHMRSEWDNEKGSLCVVLAL